MEGRECSIPIGGDEFEMSMETTLARNPVPVIVQQHVEDAAILRGIRLVLVRAPHVKLHQLGRLDERLAAHLDGVAVSGEFGAGLAEAALESPSAGAVFVCAVRAIEDKDLRKLEQVFAVAEALPEVEACLISAFGWVSSQFLQGTVSQLLGSRSPFRRRVGLAACALHRVQPVAALESALTDADPILRARALRAIGELGLRDKVPSLERAATDEDPDCQVWAAWSAVLVGERGAALDHLTRAGLAQSEEGRRAFRLALRAMEMPRALEVLRHLAKDPGANRTLIQGAGIAGDPAYVPWLIKQMADIKLTRLAGEAFTAITGVDLADQDLEVRPPEAGEFGPSENPEDQDVSMDQDDSLPWPDPEKITDWWSKHAPRFQPGVRYFLGEPPSWDHCCRALKEGRQRQRIAAAEYLCLLKPGTVLFNCAAPTWRQQRWLKALG